MDDGQDEQQPEYRSDRAEDIPDVLVPEEPQEVEMELVRVGKGVLDRDRLEERELVGAVIRSSSEVVELARGSGRVPPGVRCDREQPALGSRGVAEVVIGSHPWRSVSLDEVLGIRRVAGQPEAVAVQAIEVVAGQLRERRRGATPAGADEVGADLVTVASITFATTGSSMPSGYGRPFSRRSEPPD